MSGKKERDAANAERERLTKQHKEEQKEEQREEQEEETETKDLLGDQDNEDVIF